ncbi:MAG: efflux RND transporter periplasmic adaptor subunit [Bacteroidetes bacterium]|nr:efflux RND transporter periplasmic adaptor subunit [Bacteroidota bacterium]
MKTLFPFLLLPALLAACADNGRIEATGTLEGDDVTLSALVSGPVLTVLKKEGDPVTAGEVLVILDTTDYHFQELQARAALTQARAAWDLVRNGVRQEDLRVAEEAVSAAKANLELARRDKKRLEDLLKTQSATQKQADDAATRAEIAAATWQQAQETWQKLVRGARREDLEMARGRMEQAEAVWKLAAKKRDDCSVKSPAAGILTTLAVAAGELVLPGSQVAIISDGKNLKMSIYLKEPDLGFVSVGDTVAIRVDSFEDRDFPAVVTYLSPKAEFTPKNIQSKDDRVKLVFEARLTVPNPDGSLKAGMPGDAFITKPETSK